MTGKLFTNRETAKALGVTPETLCRWLRSNWITRTTRINGKWYYTAEEIEKARELFKIRIEGRGWVRDIKEN